MMRICDLVVSAPSAGWVYEELSQDETTVEEIESGLGKSVIKKDDQYYFQLDKLIGDKMFSLRVISCNLKLLIDTSIYKENKVLDMISCLNINGSLLYNGLFTTFFNENSYLFNKGVYVRFRSHDIYNNIVEVFLMIGFDYIKICEIKSDIVNNTILIEGIREALPTLPQYLIERPSNCKRAI
jgi:hypothetical protein